MSQSYSGSAVARAIVIATTVAGTLDLLAAFGFAIAAGGSPIGVLRGIGGAVIDAETFASPLIPCLVGLALHYGIMTIMAAVYVSTASHFRWLNRIALLGGLAYGLALWLVMFWLVLPQRWPTLFPSGDPKDIAMTLGCHMLLVGVPIALVTRSAARWRFDPI